MGSALGLLSLARPWNVARARSPSNGWALIIDLLVHLSESFNPWGCGTSLNLPRGSKAHPEQLKLGHPERAAQGRGSGGQAVAPWSVGFPWAGPSLSRGRWGVDGTRASRAAHSPQGHLPPVLSALRRCGDRLDPFWSTFDAADHLLPAIRTWQCCLLGFDFLFLLLLFFTILFTSKCNFRALGLSRSCMTTTTHCLVLLLPAPAPTVCPLSRHDPSLV